MAVCLTLAYRVMCVEINISNNIQIIMQAIHQLITIPYTIGFILIFIATFVLSYICFKYSEIVGNFVYKWRWLIACGVLIILVLFSINGSSVGSWGRYLNNNYDPGFLLGTNREIRTDEWAVNTPMAFSQFFNSNGLLPYFGEVCRGTLTDMFIVYGQPVFNIAVLFRPFQWGYLILGLERGLSFFWCARLIVLFMVSFELGMIFTKKNKPLSFAYSLLIALSPIVQWWFAINGLVEVLVFGQLAVIIVYYYMNTNSLKVRAGLMAALAICGGGYILVFYPAWQVPLAYVFLALIIWVIVDNTKNCKFTPKFDIPIIGIFVAILCIGMGYILFKSGDTIVSVLSTAYPGARVECGGDASCQFFNYPMSIAYPLSDVNAVPNVCELATFFDFFPLGLVMALLIFFKEKKHDKMLIILLIFECIIGLYCVVGFPEILAKLTLLSFSSSDRAFIVIGMFNILILIRAMSLMTDKLNVWISIGASTVFTILLIYLSTSQYSLQPDYLQTWMLLPVILALGLGSYFIFRKDNTYFAIVCVATVFLGGVMVNPIRTGVDYIYDSEIVQDIQTIDDTQEGVWAVDSLELPIINLPIMVGASTINCTNTYPNLELWQKLDPTGANDEIYNRYAHILINITDDETTFELNSTDKFTVNINVNDLEKTGINYILTDRDLETFNDDNVEFSEIEEENQYKIYEVNYR